MADRDNTIIANEDALNGLVSDLGGTIESYNYFAVHQSTVINNAIAEAFVLAVDANNVSSKIDDLTARAFTYTMQLNQEIQRLKTQYQSALAIVNDLPRTIEDGEGNQVTNPARAREIEKVHFDYSSEIYVLERKRDSYVNFINGELNQYKSDDLAKVGPAAQEVVKGLQHVEKLNMGHAYVGLRLAGAQGAISRYLVDLANGEQNAIQNYLRAMPTVLPPGQKGNPTDPVGGGWYETEEALVNMARENERNGVPPVLWTDSVRVPQTDLEIQLEKLEEQLALKQEQLENLRQDAIADAYINGSNPTTSEQQVYINAIADGREQRLEDEIYRLEEQIHVVKDDIRLAENASADDVPQAPPATPVPAPIKMTG